MAQKVVYQIMNIPWVNSTVDVWLEETPEDRTRLVVLGLKTPAGLDLLKLEETIKIKLELPEIELIPQE